MSFHTSVLSVSELESLFERTAPPVAETEKLVIGLVGYPNVGKSSTINALLGEKKTSVSATPGKTKHFQTLLLTDRITLCDCPGLVFPQFANTQADLVVDGVLPIDQMKEYSAPGGLGVSKGSEGNTGVNVWYPDRCQRRRGRWHRGSGMGRILISLCQ